MLPSPRHIRVFVASPADVREERDQLVAVVDELNRTLAPAHGLALEVVRWETHATPAIGSHPQEVINRQLGTHDVFVGIMWKRFGTPTPTAGSGTEEEFRRALSGLSQGICKALLFYFCEAPSPPPSSNDEVEQLRRVVEFRRELSQAGLVWTYTDRERFGDVVRPHLARVALELVDGVAGRPPLDDGLMRALELSKSELAARALPYYTPALMLTLLTAPNRFLARCLEGVEPGLSEKVQRSLTRYLDVVLPADTGSGFRDFDWRDHDVVQAAVARARNEGAVRTTEKHVVLALLNTPSKTVSEFKDMLGARLAAFLEIVHRAPVSVDDQLPTPGRVFPPGE